MSYATIIPHIVLLALNPENYEKSDGGGIFQIGNSIEGTIEEVVQGIIHYFDGENITIIGIGERLHSAKPLVYMFIPFILPALAKAGFKQLLCELIYEDAEGEIKDIYGMLNKHAKESTEEKIRLVKDTILGDPRKFHVLNLQCEELERDDSYYKPYDLFLLIVRAHELGVKLYGMGGISKDIRKVRGTDEELYQIGDSMRRQVKRLTKNGKLIIYAGDAHVSCKGLDMTLLQYEEPQRIVVGIELYNDLKQNYINLTLFCGTEKFVDKEAEEFLDKGREFYKEELRTLKVGMARPIVITEEDQHRIILIYNNNNDIPAGSTKSNNKSRRFTLSGSAVMVDAEQKNKESASELPESANIPVEIAATTGDAAGKEEESASSKLGRIYLGLIAGLRT